jgi:hypothetical protein
MSEKKRRWEKEKKKENDKMVKGKKRRSFKNLFKP